MSEARWHGCLALLCLSILSGCQQGLVWKAEHIPTSGVRLWGHEHLVHEAWIDASREGPALCINYYDPFGGGADESRFIFRRYSLSDGALLEELRPGAAPVPAGSPGDYARGFPTADQNRIVHPPADSDFFAHFTTEEVVIVNAASGVVVDRLPGTASSADQDGKGDLLVLSVQRKEGWRWIWNIHVYRQGKRVAMFKDDRGSVRVVRAGERPVIVRTQGSGAETPRVWLGEKETSINGRAVLAYERWLVTQIDGAVYVWDMDIIRNGSK